jgi:hypothetical protein
MCNWPPEFDPARFLRIACRAASRIARNRLVIEEAAEQAVHRFHVAVLTGEPVHHPEAWICTVARRTAWTLMRSGWAKTTPIEAEEDMLLAAECERRQWSRDRLRAAVRSALTPRQRDALDAALTSRSTREAARSCGMRPRDFRRYLAAISRRARQRLHRLKSV